MSNAFSPRLDILPPPQIALWPELRQVPAGFALYGGTALALHLAHRESVDFDFFSIKSIDPDNLLASIPFLYGSQVLQKSPNTLEVSIDRSGAIKVSFFGVPTLKRVRPPLICPDNQLPVASLLDLAGTKVSVVQVRSELKDYLDIAAILADGRITLPMALSAGRVIYGEQFNPMISLKALSYFDDGNIRALPRESKALIIDAVQSVDLEHLPPIMSTDHNPLPDTSEPQPGMS